MVAPGSILVVGDVMLDTTTHVTAERVAAEAPVVVCRFLRVEHRAGGAANVAANASALAADGTTVALVGIVGVGRPARQLHAALPAGLRSALVVSPRAQTTVKQRIVAGGMPLLRIDTEASHPDLSAELCTCVEDLCATLPPPVTLVLSDYRKGTLRSPTVGALLACAARYGISVCADTKDPELCAYASAYVLKLNRAEATVALHHAGCATYEELRVYAGVAHLLVTDGAAGITVYSARCQPVCTPAYRPAQVFDGTGAGDTVLAALAVGHAAGLSLPEAVRHAAVAAGLAVVQRGTAVICRAAVQAALRDWPASLQSLE